MKSKHGWLIFTTLCILFPSFLNLAEVGAAESIKVGAIMPLSGKGATLGIPFQRTLEMQAEEYNKAGGIAVGGKNCEVTLIIEDSKYTAEGAKLAAEKLIFRDKVKFILGPVISPGCILLNPIAEEAKVLHFANGSSPKNIGPGYTYGFRPYLTATERMPSQYKWVKETLSDVKKVGSIDIGDETGHSTTASIRRAAEKNGFELCDPVYYPRGTSDFYPIVTKLLAMKPDYIDCGSGSLGEIGLIVKSARQLGYKGYMSMAMPQSVKELCQIAGEKNAEGFIFSDTLVAEGLPATKMFKEKYVSRWKDWDPYTLKWSVFLPILIDGIKAAGTTEDTQMIRDTLEKMEFETTLGHLRWSGKKTYGISHQIYSPYGIAQVRNCELHSFGVLPAEKVIEAMGEE